MLRVGLTGELGSGKSTVAKLLAARGAIVLSSDEIGRAMMQPGQPVYEAIVQHFGPSVVLADGQLNRPELSRLAFDPQHPRVEELNAIVHPAVIAEQERRIEQIRQQHPKAFVVIESALIFTTRHAAGNRPWQERFDRIVLVTAPDNQKLDRYVQRVAAGREISREEKERLRADAQARLTAQRIPPSLAADCLVLENTGSQEDLARRTEEVFRELLALADAVETRDPRA